MLRITFAPVVFFLLFATAAVTLHAQTDSVTTWKVTVGDSAKKDTLVKRIKPEHPPKTAAILSACLPGLGQAYNGKGNYWKIPVMYAGFGGLGYMYYWNNRERRIYADALHLRYDSDSTTSDNLTQYSDNDLVTLKNYYGRYRDLATIGMVLLYTINIVDAAVYAHLWHFDNKMNSDLSLRVSPSATPTANGWNAGVQVKLSFR